MSLTAALKSAVSEAKQARDLIDAGEKNITHVPSAARPPHRAMSLAGATSWISAARSIQRATVIKADVPGRGPPPAHVVAV
jgi:hypothetical protein